jgi:hypothetical protein
MEAHMQPDVSRVTRRDLDGGHRIVVRANAISLAESRPTIDFLLGHCPEGYHPVRIEVKKSGRGRRAHVSVYFQRNRKPAPPTLQ